MEAMQVPEEHRIIVEAARGEAQRMRGAVATDCGENARVAIAVSQFAKLADLLDHLADAIDFPAEEGLNDPRYWVPLGHFQKVRAEATQWRAKHDQLLDAHGCDDPLRF